MWARDGSIVTDMLVVHCSVHPSDVVCDQEFFIGLERVRVAWAGRMFAWVDIVRLIGTTFQRLYSCGVGLPFSRRTTVNRPRDRAMPRQSQRQARMPTG